MGEQADEPDQSIESDGIESDGIESDGIESQRAVGSDRGVGAQDGSASWGRLAVGTLVWLVGGVLLLLAAGSWGAAGVAVVAAAEAVAVYSLYRWSPS